jgi:hypothetical protein
MTRLGIKHMQTNCSRHEQSSLLNLQELLCSIFYSLALEAVSTSGNGPTAPVLKASFQAHFQNPPPTFQLTDILPE